MQSLKVKLEMEDKMVQIKQDRFTTCFKNLWNKPLWVLALQKKNQTVLKTKQVKKLAAPLAPSNLLPNLLPNLSPDLLLNLWEQK